MNEYELEELGYQTVPAVGAGGEKMFSWQRKDGQRRGEPCSTMTAAIRGAFADAASHEGGVFNCSSCGRLQTGNMMASAAACVHCGGSCTEVRLEDEPEDPRFVIYAASESGYWSNEYGWGALATADTFSSCDADGGLHLPVSAKRDATWVIVTPDLMASLRLEPQLRAMASAIAELKAAWHNKWLWKEHVLRATHILEDSLHDPDAAGDS